MSYSQKGSLKIGKLALFVAGTVGHVVYIKITAQGVLLIKCIVAQAGKVAHFKIGVTCPAFHF